MRLDDLLTVMRDEFAQAADVIDGHVMQWLGGGAEAAFEQAEPLAAELERVANTARVISLEGLAIALEQVHASVSAMALLDEDTMGLGLSWLAGWRAPFEQCFASPGGADPADELLQWLAGGPLAPEAGTLAALRCQLVLPPRLPEDAEGANALLPEATEDDVSLAVPEDVDPGLYDTFLADAPRQVERLSDLVRALVSTGLEPGLLQEAQRVAHTFKGSGSIIGLRGIGRLAHRIEDLIEFAGEQGARLPGPMGHDLEQACATLEQMVYALRGEEAAPTDARARLQALLDWANAIREDRWQALAEQRTAAGFARTATAAPVALAPAAPAEPQPAAGTAAESETQLRVAAPLLARLVRRAGQGMVQGARLGEHVHTLGARLRAMEDNVLALHKRVSELSAALDRQGVSLREKADAVGGEFDPLELDRYNQVHELARFVAELADDELELVRSARSEAVGAAAHLREHAAQLKEQHRELLGARLLPFKHVVSRLKRTVSQTASVLGREVRLEIEGDHVQLDADVLERMTEPLLHLLRNAVDHGIESPAERLLSGKPEQGVITLSCRREGQIVHVVCRDDGRGIDLQAVQAKAVALGLLAADANPDADAVARLILLPGFSTRDEVTEVSGRGVGMDVVAERVRAMKGQLDIATTPASGSAFTLRVPATTGSAHALVVEAGGEQFALPTDSVLRAMAAGLALPAEGQVLIDGQTCRHARLADWLGLPAGDLSDEQRPLVLVRTPAGPLALSVDRVIDARELILQDLGALLRRARGVVGAALRSDGRALFVLDPAELSRQGERGVDAQAAARMRQRAQLRRRRVLVVDDAISVRKAVSQLLADAGYETEGARDGFDAIQALSRARFDLVLTDLEMPNLNGLELTRQLRGRPELAALPIVMITSRATDKHRQAALDAGVNLYLTKPYTDGELLGHVRQLLAVAGAAA
jgi:chemotaxis protein histidine kinase CheA/CheY-like chemotaxis protein